MSAREWFNSNPTATTVIVISALVVALVVVAWSAGVLTGGAPPQDRAIHYWDLEEERVFVAARGQTPPIEAPSGGEGAIAHLFSCGNCSEDEWFGYLERYSDDYHRAVETGQIEQLNAIERGQFQQHALLYRPLEGGDWVQAHSEAGQQLVQDVRARCGGEHPQACTP